MKFKLALLPVYLLSPVTKGSVTIINNNSIAFNFKTMGPFVEYNDDVSLSGTLSVTKSYSGLRERISIAEDEDDYSYFYTTASHSMTSRKSRTVTFNLPLSSMLSEYGIRGVVEVLNSSGDVLLNRPFYLMPVSPKTINVSKFLNKDYNVDDVIVNITNYNLYHRESYSFTEFLDYFNVDTYYQLDISQLKMSYTCFESFPGANGVLHFVDYNHLFPYIDDNNDVPEVDIPIRIYQKKKEICFDFPEIMYVNKKTLEMSLVARPGFLPTSHFYLPINKKDQLLDQVFTLQVTDFGFGKTSFNWNMRYLNSRGLVGDCSDSDYCVIGEVM